MADRESSLVCDLWEVARQSFCCINTESRRRRSLEAPMVQQLPVEEVQADVAGTDCTDVAFVDAHGHACLVRLNEHKELDLFINGQLDVRNMQDFEAEGDTLYFTGRRQCSSNHIMKTIEEAREILARILALGAWTLEDKAMDLLSAGDVKILSAEWMLQRPTGYVLQRCQDLPSEAFVPPETAALLLRRMFSLVVLSYPWLSKHHPDPTGFHFQIVQQYLAKHRDQARVVARGSHSANACDENVVGLFWDFASLPQIGSDGKRTQEENDTFRRGLDAVNILYGSQRTIALLQTGLPTEHSDITLNLRPYRQRGWCIFEATISNVLKSTSRCLDLGADGVRALLAQESSSWPDIRRLATVKRRPFLNPDALRAELDKTVFTNGKRDRALVANKYEDFFFQAAAAQQELAVVNRGDAGGWDDDDMKQFGASLPAFARVEELWLHQHNFSDHGLYAVLEPLPKLTKLSHLRIRNCAHFSGTCFQALTGARMPALTYLDLGGTGIDEDGLNVFAQQMACFPTLRMLVLFGCVRIGAAGVKALAENLPADLEELYLGRSALCDEGLQWLVKRLPSLHHLCRLDFRGCKEIGKLGLAALTSCLPRLPAMVDVQSCAECPYGHELSTSSLGLWAWPCSRCGDAPSKGDLIHVCSCDFMVCDICRYGSVWLPSHLESIAEGQVLVDTWAMGGREKNQLQWV